MKKIDLIRSLSDGSLTADEIAKIASSSVCYVREIVQNDSNLKLKRKSLLDSGSVRYGLTNHRAFAVSKLCDGVRTSAQIAEMLGEDKKYVQNVMLKFDLPRRYRGSATSELNGQYKTGRRIDHDGYVLVSAPENHPFARLSKNRRTGIMYEHRLLMEKKIGRYLTPDEVVDHIDGLRLHNSLDNLRLFLNNSEHLKSTITGCTPRWSQEGFDKMSQPNHLRAILPQIHNYQKMKAHGDARLIQILLAMLKLGSDSPFLLGSSHHLKKVGISDLSHSNLEHELDKLYRKYG